MTKTPEARCLDCFNADINCQFRQDLGIIQAAVRIGTIDPTDAHNIIGRLRETARQEGCPNVNDDVDYPGKNKL